MRHSLTAAVCVGKQEVNYTCVPARLLIVRVYLHGC